MTPRRIACIGAGYWGKNLVRNFSELGALAWICEMDASRHAALRKDYGEVRITASFDEVLQDPQVAGVAISTPAESHGRLVELALKAGKDVFVEKPLCLSATEGEKLVELADRQRRVLMVGHLLWYHPAVLKLKQLINDGELGRIQYIYSNRLNLGKIRREENILWSFAPHDVSVILGLANDAPDSLHAQGGNYLHPQIADVTVSTMSFPNGIKAHIFVSWLHPFKEQKLVVVGDRKMAVFDDVEKVRKLVVYPHSIGWKNNIPVASKAEAEVVPIEACEPLREECSHFLQCIESRETPRTDGREGVRVLRVLQGFQEALSAGASIRGAAAPVSAPAGSAAAKQPETGSAAVSTIHPSACIDAEVTIGEGTSIWHFSHVLPKSTIGKNCRIGQNVVIGPKVAIGDGVKIQNNVSVYEGVTLEDHVFCGPSMVFTNVFNPRSEVRRMAELKSTLVRQGATLGANCTIVCGVTIGRYAFVGAGAVVTRDVHDYALVVGNPARQTGWMCQCGIKLPWPKDAGSSACLACQRRYQKTSKGLMLNG